MHLLAPAVYPYCNKLLGAKDPHATGRVNESLAGNGGDAYSGKLSS